MKSIESTAQLVRLLGHPLRLRIVAGLAVEPRCVRDLCECLGLQQAVISQHLAMLRAVGIISGTRQGVEMHYEVVDPLAKGIVDFLQHG